MMARTLAQAGQPSFRYLFTHRSGGGLPLHSDKLRYVFGTLANPGFTHQPPPGATDRAVSTAMMDAWVRFARTGKPDGSGLAPWPAAAGATDLLLEFKDTSMVLTDYRSHQLDFIQKVFASH